MAETRKLKICLAASAGGHTSQLLKIKECYESYQTFYVTTTSVVAQQLHKFGKVYVVGESNRQNLLRVIFVLIRCLKIILNERPNVVISTGAAVGCIMCFLSWIFSAKIIWIDSIANVDKLSLSGRMVRCIADLFLVQWPEVVEKYKNVEYAGTII
jgi:UDP-N-acetylglucosamine:LPS N-acetylglucosamine transferase